jgi:hypothetical protein
MMMPSPFTFRRSLLPACRVLAGTLAALALTGCQTARPKLDGPSTSYRAADQTSALAESQDASAASLVRAEVLSTEPWTFATAEGRVVRTNSYRIYSTVENPLVSTRLASFLEHALAHYRTELGPLPAPSQRLDVYLMNNRPQWEAVTKSLMGEQAETLLKIPRGGYASRGVGVYYNIGVYDTLSIAGHEGWHQYTQRAFKEQLPVWLEEGVATFMEGHRWEQQTPVFRPWANVQRFDQLRNASQKGELLPLPELLDSRPQDLLDYSDDRVLGFYAQTWALVHFLREGEGGKYRASLLALLNDAAEGRLSERLTTQLGDRAGGSALVQRTGPGVFLAYFSADIDAVALEYQRFLESLVQTGARSAIADGRNPFGVSGGAVR